MSFKHHKQMSESFLTAAFLSVSGGLQDAYTYIFRGKVFANAQTGNIVLLSQSIIEKDFGRAIHYLVPLLFFALGIAIAECIHVKFQRIQHIHWRQLVLVLEILLLLVVGFLPTRPMPWFHSHVPCRFRAFVKSTDMLSPAPCASATSEAAQMPYVLLSVPVIKTLCANPCATGESFYSLPSVQVSAVTALQFSACEPYGFPVCFF